MNFNSISFKQRRMIVQVMVLLNLIRGSIKKKYENNWAVVIKNVHKSHNLQIML